MTSLELQSTITCPHCGAREKTTMPTNACVFFHECAGCHEMLRAKSGDCCVFCSYGDVPCPPRQPGSDACADGCGATDAPRVPGEHKMNS